MYSSIAANKRNTVVIIALFVAVIAGLGWLISQIYGSTGIFWGVLVGSGIYAFFSISLRQN